MVSARPVVFGVEPLGTDSGWLKEEIITVASGRTDTFASHTVTRSLSIAGLRAIGTAVCNSIAQNIRTPVMEAPFGLGISRSGHDKSRRGRMQLSSDCAHCRCGIWKLVYRIPPLLTQSPPHPPPALRPALSPSN